jgi:hypothetical protein
MHQGRLDTAFHASDLYFFSYYFSGMDLRPLSRDMAAIISEVFFKYKAKLRILHVLPLFQLVLKLIGDNDGHDILDMYSGRAMDFRNQLLGRGGWDAMGPEGRRPGEVAQWSYSLHLYVYCEEWDKATNMYEKIVDLDIGVLRSFPMWHNRVFFMAMVALQNAKQSPWIKRRKWLLAFEKHYGLMRMWVSDRKALNLVHKFQILEVMKLTVDQGRTNPSDALLQTAFDRAIKPALRVGLFQDAALGASLAANAVQDRDAKHRYAALAQHCYKKWGAYGVVRHLRLTSKLHSVVDVAAYFEEEEEDEDIGINSNNRVKKKSPNEQATKRNISIRSKERFSSVNVPLMMQENTNEGHYSAS